MSGEERRGSREAAVRFQRRLAALKRNGCNLLLVGTDGLDAACQRLLGESSAGPRHRLFVTTDARPATARARLASVQPGPYADAAEVVDWQTSVRGGVGADASRADASETETCVRGGTPSDDSELERGLGVGSDESALRRTLVESDDLGDLAVAVEEAVERFASEAGSLSPAELRLCVDSLTPLVGEHDDEEAGRFLRDLFGTVERHDGMGHYHLPAEYGSEAVASVESLFDAVVEVRYAAETVEQRWHLHDPEFTTGWLAL